MYLCVLYRTNFIKLYRTTTVMTNKLDFRYPRQSRRYCILLYTVTFYCSQLGTVPAVTGGLQLSVTTLQRFAVLRSVLCHVTDAGCWEINNLYNSVHIDTHLSTRLHVDIQRSNRLYVRRCISTRCI
jgi:hypothetical protein